MSACCDDDKEYQMATKFYCCLCIIKHFGRPKQVGKWDNELCLACGETLLDEGMWNNISGRGKTCDKLCQYMILISNWVRKGTPIDTTWRCVVKRLDGCPHNNDEICNCTSELESIFNPDSNSNNDDDENNGSSFAQNSNNFNSDSNSNSNSETYIALPDLTKEQELK
ncbi:hypothetical protein G9A89_006192 [Geosiphon pyriformis]|nr:hypothetical protein G9A89_006192 [Geosiphon pyriformis]